MASPFVLDASAETFPTLVLENSARGLVVALFWSPRAAPCMMIMPRLTRLAESHAGRFLLVRLNVDELARLARDWGVASVPTVKFFRHGQVVHTIHGAESEASLRAALERYLPRAANPARLEAQRLFQSGEVDAAYAKLAQAALDDPDDPLLPLDLARLMVRNGEHARAHALLANLPQPAASHPEIERLFLHLSLILAAEAASEPAALEARLGAAPDDSAARFARAARRLVDDDFLGAADDLLELIARDPQWEQGLARRALLAVLDLPAFPSQEVAECRRRLASLLHR
ncbi:tetratricopeptide repeat protein [Thiobacter aerophilum]|uniref:Tetratricopeptide repeat protein n=1 Tax=Thiobacter aerophilum TaxID=3121275 RepID=A0ABV0EGJ3_9BURK